jgi:hypothetical protein
MTAPTPPTDIELFATDCVFMRSVYRHRDELYEKSNDAEIALMERTASLFFGDLSEVFRVYLILGVCRMTDPANQGKHQNLSVEFLLQHHEQDFSSEPNIGNQLKEISDKIIAFGKKLRPVRDKLIAHSDRDTIKAGVPLGGRPKEEWQQYWLDLQAFVNIIYKKVTGIPNFYINGTGTSDADAVLRALKNSSYFFALVTHSDPAVRKACSDLLDREYQ